MVDMAGSYRVEVGGACTVRAKNLWRSWGKDLTRGLKRFITALRSNETRKRDAMSHTETVNAYQVAAKKIREMEDAGKSDRAMSKTWAEYFRLEDALKAEGSF